MGVKNYKAITMGFEDSHHVLMMKYRTINQFLTIAVVFLTTTIIMMNYDTETYWEKFLEDRGVPTFSDLLMSDSRRMELEIRKHNLEIQQKNNENSRDENS